VVFALAGTTVDCGCFSPVVPFVEALAAHGVSVSADEARGPMGLSKRDHLAALLADPAIGGRWQAAHGRPASAGDVDAVYEAFVPLQVTAAADPSELVPGAVDLLAALRARGVRVATTTGYFRAAAEVVWQAMAAQGFIADLHSCPEDVGGQGRPAPWMIYRAMQQVGCYPPSRVVKVGDTLPDIAEGLAAGCWSLGVTRTGSDVGCTPAEFAALPAGEQRRRLTAAEAKLRDAGAHGVLDTVVDLPDWLDTIEGWLAAGRRP